MRKRNISLFFDYLFWGLVYSFPLLIVLVMSIKSAQVIDLYSFFTSNGYNILSSGVVFDCLNSLFGFNGLLPLFADNSGLIYYCSWFISCVLLHLVVDFILFIPRLAHKYMSSFTNSEV